MNTSEKPQQDPDPDPGKRSGDEEKEGTEERETADPGETSEESFPASDPPAW